MTTLFEFMSNRGGNAIALACVIKPDQGETCASISCLEVFQLRDCHLHGNRSREVQGNAGSDHNERGGIFPSIVAKDAKGQRYSWLVTKDLCNQHGYQLRVVLCS